MGAFALQYAGLKCTLHGSVPVQEDWGRGVYVRHCPVASVGESRMTGAQKSHIFLKCVPTYIAGWAGGALDKTRPIAAPAFRHNPAAKHTAYPQADRC